MYKDVNIEYKGVELRVYGSYSPPTPPVLTFDGGYGHMGDRAEFEVEGIEFYGDDFYDLLESQLAEIEQAVIEHLQTKDIVDD